MLINRAPSNCPLLQTEPGGGEEKQALIIGRGSRTADRRTTMMKKSAERILVFVSIVTMFIGGVIYMLWRSTDLTMFSWFRRIGIMDEIALVRGSAASFLSPPDWVLYSMPTAMWMFSGLLALCVIWNSFTDERLIWVTVFAVFGIGLELCQRIGVLPGIFDVVDLVLALVFGALAVVIQELVRRSERNG